MVSSGQHAPGFELPGTDGGEFERYTLAAATETGVAVLVFYPFDFSPVCTSELCEFRDAEWLQLTDDVDVYGISLDACYAHRRFVNENRLGFPLLSDTTGETTRAYGIDYDEWEYHKGVPKRAVVVVDDGQTVRYRWVADDAYQSPDIEEVHAAISEVDAVDLADE